ncbi:hypothetical protein [Paenibacillus sp. L3-i20]|uniref:hypothetical protein n=1 Tax=Paenibacillus sp. L3-i20 TaxID=2905833 RepID=UPI001EDCCAFC|nr:hypothetical protein [Paenibacillus sp. L3-i20]GKU79339.1 hypothetical protein L3i20_v237360 [Paenibacillus sp. L3-i20]
MDGKIKRLQDAQLRDVEEMKAIYEVAAGGKDATTACELVLGNSFKLSSEVAAGIERGETVCE